MAQRNMKNNNRYAGEQVRTQPGHRRKMQISIGIATIAAGATAAYFLAGKRGAQNRRKLKTWMVEAKREILSRFENLNDLTEDRYRQIIDSVVQRYRGLREASPEEIAAFVRELQGSWKNISGRVRQAGSRRRTPAQSRTARGARSRSRSAGASADDR